MKTLSPIVIGDYTVTVTVEPHGTHFLKFVARCGNISADGIMTPAGTHDRAELDFAKGIQDYAERVARECAGKCRSADLRRKFLEQ